MKKYLIVALATLALSGCIMLPQTTEQQQQQQPQTPTTPQIQPQPSAPVDIVPNIGAPETSGQPPVETTIPQAPKVQSIDWSATVQPLVAKMLKADGVQVGSVLLLDNVKNSTNGSLQTGKITAAMHTALASNNTFTIVPASQLESAKQAMGLSADDNLVSRSKAIALARQVNAQYVLYSDASGNVKSPTLDMQLMTVQTGEIVWSGSGAVQN